MNVFLPGCKTAVSFPSACRKLSRQIILYSTLLCSSDCVRSFRLRKILDRVCRIVDLCFFFSQFQHLLETMAEDSQAEDPQICRLAGGKYVPLNSAYYI